LVTLCLDTIVVENDFAFSLNCPKMRDTAGTVFDATTAMRG
jgi:hypothetical protein